MRKGEICGHEARDGAESGKGRIRVAEFLR